MRSEGRGALPLALAGKRGWLVARAAPVPPAPSPAAHPRSR